MKHSYLSIIFLTTVIFISCKQQESSGNKTSHIIVSSTPEEDQTLLDKRLAYTERVWDSLSNILSREDLDEEYRASIKKLYLENRYKQEDVYKDFIKENPNSEISVANLNGFKFTWGKETTEELYNLMGSKQQNSETGKLIKRFLDYYREPQINDLYTDFELKNLDGEEINLSDNLEDYTLLDFWTTYCKYCRENHKELIKIYDKFNERGFTIIGISLDDDLEKLKRAVAKDDLPWINLILPDGRESKVHHQYGVYKTPTYFLIGPDGKIIAKDIRPAELEKLLSRNI